MDIVRAGITDIPEVKCSLKYYVDTILTVKLGTRPVAGDRAFNFIQPIWTSVIMLAEQKEYWSCRSMIKKTYDLKLRSGRKLILSRHFFSDHFG